MTQPLKQIRTENGQLFPSPAAGERMEETPPVFAFIREKGAGLYRVIVQNAQGQTVVDQSTAQCFLRPDHALPAGKYRWQLRFEGCQSDWVPFEISPNAVPFLMPKAEQVLSSVPACRPRHLFFADDIPALLHRRAEEINTLRRNVAQALSDGLPPRPAFHTDKGALPYHEFFIRHRQYVDRDLVACALAWALLGDAQACDHAVGTLEELLSWGCDGPCALNGPWGDEVGLSHARCLPAVVDLLWTSLSPTQRQAACQALARYGEQCWQRLQSIDYEQNPGNSHAGRLPAYLGEIALCLQGTNTLPRETLLAWLQYALEIYGGIFPFYGGPDGGWAEGVFYATSYAKWFLPFFSMVSRFAGVRFLDRPFYQRYPVFLEHFVVPRQENYPFGDGYWNTADSAEFPGFFAQDPYRVYARRAQRPLLSRFERELAAPPLFELHLLDVFLPDMPPYARRLPTASERAAAFPYAGFLSLHSDPFHPERDLALLARGSRYGSVSHQHADQGSFCLKYGGHTLISPSGYYGRCYGTPHHRQWTNSSKAHNTILIDGEGQPTWSIAPTARVLYARDEKERLTGAIDATGAYPQLKRWLRTFELTDTALIVRDEILLAQAAELTYCLHMLSQPTPQGVGLLLRHHGVALAIRPLTGLSEAPEISAAFDPPVNAGVEEKYAVARPDQYHVFWRSDKKQAHHIEVAFALQKEC